MDISLFFRFPGILILIGAVLLVIAIIIGVIAYKNDDNVSKNESFNTDESIEDAIDQTENVEETK